MLSLIRYDSSLENAWDNIISNADNGHFMFKRNFMDYHADRFIDCSFLVLLQNDVIGVIPGNIVAGRWYSHQGLSFGGVLMHHKHNRILLMQRVLSLLFASLEQLGITEVVYKFIPYIYHNLPCDSDIFVLSKFKVKQEIYDISSTVKLSLRPKYSEIRIRGKKRATQANVNFIESDDWERYWEVLSHRLHEKYAKKPVHNLNEIILLKSRFPENIKLFVAIHPTDGICAGVVIFETKLVAHCQYIAASDVGLQVCALDGLFMFLIEHYERVNKQYFNFGISTENHGEYLNENLIQFKEGFGARSMVHVTRHYLI